MSTLIVEVCKIENVQNHPQADKLDLVQIKGWNVVCKRDEYKIGDKCVYVPPDTILPEEVAKKFNVEKYLQPLPRNPDGTRDKGGRIRVASLRGIKSFGLIIPCENTEWLIGHSVVEYYGFTKWEQPLVCKDGDAEKPHNSFHRYTDIEHYANFPGVLEEDELVVLTEKLHGSNLRMAMIRDKNENGEMEFKFMVGSHNVRRKEFYTETKTLRDPYTKEPQFDENNQPIKITKTQRCIYWNCLSEEIKFMLKELCDNENNVIVFGEMFGASRQDMDYGISNFDFRAFDLMINDKYLNYEDKKKIFEKYNIPMVPILYMGPFSKNLIEKYVDGPTTICTPDKINSKFKGREGIIITPTVERNHPKVGRVIFKCVSFDYLNRKNGTEYH